MSLGVDNRYVGWDSLRRFDAADGVVIRRTVVMREILNGVGGALMGNWLV